MRGSILVNFDELIDDRGVDQYSVAVNNVLRDTHSTATNNLYSTFMFVGDVVQYALTLTAGPYKNISIKRVDYTTDAEDGDRGIKETEIIPDVLVNTTTSYAVRFTGETVSNAYNFKYVIDGATFNSFVVRDCSGVNDDLTISISGTSTGPSIGKVFKPLKTPSNYFNGINCWEVIGYSSTVVTDPEFTSITLGTEYDSCAECQA